MDRKSGEGVTASLKLTSLALSFTVLSGCKLAVMVSSAGYVQSHSGTQNCHGPDYCEFEITDADFSETFTAVARPGYEFVQWQDGEGFLCAGSTDPDCLVELDGSEVGEAVVAASATASLRPLFRDTGTVIDTDGDGTPDESDWDDDNDGVGDYSDNCPLEGPNLDREGCPFNADWEDEAVVIGDKLWAQPMQFNGLTWSDIDRVCPAPTRVCSGPLRLLDVTGWTWASTDDVLALLNSFFGTSLSEPYDAVYDNGRPVISPVLFRYLRSEYREYDGAHVYAWASDEANVVEAYLYEAGCAQLDQSYETIGYECSNMRVGAQSYDYPYTIGNPYGKNDAYARGGAWLYKPAP